MRFLFAFCAALLVLASPALAEGDIFLKQHEPSESKQLFTKPEQNHVPVEQETRILANSYYENCLLENHPVLTPASKNILCACTSAKLSEEMTPPQIKAMFEEGPAGDEARNRMLMFVYAPCMEYPVRDLITQNCMGNPEVAKTASEPTALCECLGNQMGAYMAEKGPVVIEMALRTNPDSLDPLGNFFNSYAFQAQSRQHMSDCIRNTQGQPR